MVCSRPLAIDLFTGLHGWADGLVAEGFDVVGFDLEDMCAQFRQPRPRNVQLVIQDVLTLHGSQFRDADLIVASPPCQRYSWMAMPWKRAKAKAAAIRADTTGRMLADLNRLFDACFRIQAQASLAAGRHIPMVVENVRGAQLWVGRARWNFGSYYLWGDVPALMPQTSKVKIGGSAKVEGIGWTGFADTGASWRNRECALKAPGFRFDGSGRSFQSASVAGLKGIPHRTAGHWTNLAEHGLKQGGTWWHDEGSISRPTGSASPSRKMASAMIAKIPLPLSRHIAKFYHPSYSNRRHVITAARPQGTLFDTNLAGERV